ncbi:MAG: PDZ domain-containing protein [Candidatus Scalindua sp.]|jgi:hypothetical protein|nr:PDZ domain-containing protein [Candidatus Scalindua sp.]
MKLLLQITATLLFSLLTRADCSALVNTIDPYVVFNEYYDAIGGLKKVKAEKTVYLEGRITFDGLDGTYRLWSGEHLHYRTTEDYGIINQTFGDNGRFSWMVDTNGKIQIQRDEETLKRRRITKFHEAFEHLNPNSEIFILTFEGVQKVKETECYVIRTTNSINDDIYLDYFSTLDFYQIKSIVKQPDIQIHTLLSDYRDVNGVKHSFHEESEILPRDKKEIIQLNKYEVNIEINPALFEPPEKDVRDYHFIENECSENIPFQLIENNIFLPVNMNGKKRLWLLDNGASMSVIDYDHASTIGLKPEGRINGVGIEKTFELSFVKLPPYRIEGLQLDTQTIFVFQGLSERFHAEEAVGILGYDFLSRFVTKIDYADRLISFYNPETFIYNGNGCVLDAPLKEKTFNLTGTVDRKYSGKWRLDLGAFDISFHFPFASNNGLLDRKGIDRISTGLGGRHFERTLQFKTIQLGELTVTNPLISVPLEKSKGSNSSSESIGNIGNSLLRNFVIYLDYERQQVIIEKGENFNKSFPVDKSGFQIGSTDNGLLEIVFISPDTPAARAGFLEGDIIKSINNIDVKYFPELITLKKLLREKPGTEYTFRVLRNGQIEVIKLMLQDLF